MKSKLYQIKKIAIDDHRDYRNEIIVERAVLTEPFGFHWHTYYEIEYVTDGSGTEVINGESIPLTPGVLHIVSPSDFHELCTDSSVSLVKICFDISDVSPDVLKTIPSSPQKRRFSFCGKDKELFDRLFESALLLKETMLGREEYAPALRRLLETILLSAASYVSSSESGAELMEKSDDISTVLAYIQANFTRGITLSEVAEKMHFSPSYLSRRFHESMGITFGQHIKKLRMELSSKLLVNTDSDVTDICYVD